MITPSDPLRRVAVALDTDDRATFDRWCDELGGRVGVLKVGLEAFVRFGPDAVRRAVDSAPAVFLDLKLHDIPNTVGGAVRSAIDLGVAYLTVHAGGGRAMLEAAAEAAAGHLDVLAVTVLTHLDDEALAELDVGGSIAGRVERWGRLAIEAGCRGVVCSPREVAALRATLPPASVLVTPGIRPAGSERGDQRRVATPAEAIQAGSSLLVIGRPVTRAEDPEAVLAALADELSGVLGSGQI